MTTAISTEKKALDPLIEQVLQSTVTPEPPADESEAKQLKIKERKRNLERMRSEEIYMLSLTVRKGTQKKNLDVRSLQLELHDDLIQAVLDNDAQLVIDSGRQSIIVPTFPELRAYGVKLESDRAKLQRCMIYADPYWFAFNDRLNELCQGYEAMEARRTSALDELLEPDAYLNAKIEYLTRLQNILVASRRVTKLQLAEMLEQFAVQFPTPEQVRSNFTVSCQGPIRIPSLTEQSADDASLAEALAKQVQSEALIRESQSRAKLQQAYVESIHKAIFEDAPKTAINNAYALIAELMTEIGKADPSKASYRLKQKLQKKIQELEVLVDFNTDLENVVMQMNQLTHVATSSVSAEHLQHRLEQFKADFLNDLDINPDEGDGHRALADWVML